MISDKYDEKEDYILPACIVLGSFEFAKNLIGHQAVMYQLKENRVHGLAHDMMKSTDDNLYVKMEGLNWSFDAFFCYWKNEDIF